MSTDATADRMTARDISYTVKRIYCDVLGGVYGRKGESLEVCDIDPFADFEKELGGDSNHSAKVMWVIEESFGIEIPGVDLNKLMTVDDATVYIRERINPEHQDG